MKLLIVSTAPFIFKGKKCFAYSPYVAELVIWNKYADTIAFCCPVWESERGLLVSKLPFEIHQHFKLVEFNLNSVINIATTFFSVFCNIFILFKTMYQADYIHLRCPGNIGLLGCLVQIFFPNKLKTAKYAGNWDPKAKQPWSYRLQKWILSNTFLTRNMQVLVYGEWENQSKNIQAFFTATYSESEKEIVPPRQLNRQIYFLFVGTLRQGKNPLYAVHLVESLKKMGYDVVLNLYGEGVERKVLADYITLNSLEGFIELKGNQPKEVLKEVYRHSHFIILPSKSEGWPKAVAEGMFWGCVPISTSVSCVPYMLGHGERGLLLQMDLEKDVQQIALLLQNQKEFSNRSEAALHWSRQYTTDVFEQEIKRMVKN